MGWRGRGWCGFETLSGLLELLLPWAFPNDMEAPNSLPLSHIGLEDWSLPLLTLPPLASALPSWTPALPFSPSVYL